MINCNRNKCLWCGGCIPVCPQSAIFLNETRIEIDERCNNCLLCVRVCPVGALYEVEKTEVEKSPEIKVQKR